MESQGVVPAPLEPLGHTVPLAERAYLAIREAIATRRIRPGDRLTERSLAMLLGVSPTPIRAAITALYRTAEVFGRERRVRSVQLMQTARRDVGARRLQAHRALVEALAAHDEDGAERVVRDHLGSTLAVA